MKLGFSHSVFVPIPPHIKAEVPTATKVVLSCTDKHQLGLFAVKVRKWRPPEPYKGKACSISVLFTSVMTSFPCRGFSLEPSRSESRPSRRNKLYKVLYSLLYFSHHPPVPVHTTSKSGRVDYDPTFTLRPSPACLQPILH